MSRKVVVYLADLSHSRFGFSPSTVPLAVGYLKAYAMTQLSNEVDIRLFRSFDPLYAAIQEREPDIVGCSWYGWNRWLTIDAFEHIKSRSPHILTMAGGANVPDKPEDLLRDLKGFPSIDLLIPNEAEIPFVSMLKAFIHGGRESVFKQVMGGVFYRSDRSNGGGGLVGETLPTPKLIDEFPSPYLAGTLDDFIRNEELMPIVQTSRGCPFKCTFCVAAKDAWNKVRGFELGRVKAEIDYLQAHAKNRGIRLTDENWGILPRDVEIARYLAGKRAESGYPNAFRSYTHKDVNDTIKGITLALSDLIPVNISIQTLTDSVVENIKRNNVTLEKFKESVEWAHKNNLNVTTELIFGLPGESYSSFMRVIDALMDLRIDSISIATLMMLKETEVVRPEVMEKHGYKMMHGVSERGYTKVGEFDSVETDAFAVESNNFTFEDYVRAQLFIVIFQLFMFCGYLKEMVYVWLNRGVKVADVVTELIDHPELYPFFGQQTKRLRECLQKNLFNTREEACAAFRKLVSQSDAEQYIGFMSPFALPKIMSGDLIHASNHETMVDETIRAATALFHKSGIGALPEFQEEMIFAKALAQSVVIPYWEMPQETAELSSPYDLVSWRNHDYAGTLSEFRLPSPQTCRLTVQSMDQYRDFIREFGGQPFYRQSEAFFRTFRTNNIRRYLSSAGERDQRRGRILGNTARDGDDS